MKQTSVMVVALRLKRPHLPNPVRDRSRSATLCMEAELAKNTWHISAPSESK